MPRQDLISSKTDLKSLKYGSSGPYIVKDINNPPVYNTVSAEITHRIDDTIRIGKILTSTPGLKFALNQAFLNYSSSEKKGFGKRLLGSLGDTAKVLGSTIAQVPVNGTGTHFVIGFGGHEYLKQGGSSSSWLARFLQTTGGVGGVNGAKSALEGKPIILDNRGEDGYKPMIESELVDKEYVDQLKVDVAQTYIHQEGRPLAKEGSIIIPLNVGQEGYKPVNDGIDRTDAFVEVDINNTYTQQDGRTLIKGTDGTTVKATVPTRIDDEPEVVIDKFKSSLQDLSVDSKTGYDTTAATSRDIKDPFQKSTKGLSPKLEENATTPPAPQSAKSVDNTLTPYNTDGKLENKSSTLDADSSIKSQEVQTIGKPVLKDFRAKTGSSSGSKYNTQAVHQKGKKGNVDTVTHNSGEYKKNDDMIPFIFSILTPENPDKPQRLHFRAFLDSMDDNFSATWNGFNYIGRGEKFYTYGGFERKSTLSFKIAAFNESDLAAVYAKANLLASATMPSYDAKGTWMRGTFMRMTVGTYFDDQPCLLNSVGISVDVNVPWEIDLDGTVGMEVPHVLNVSLDFTVLHDKTPRVGLDKEYFGFRKSKTPPAKAGGEQDPAPKKVTNKPKVEPLPVKKTTFKMPPIEPIRQDNTRNVPMERLKNAAEKMKIVKKG